MGLQCVEEANADVSGTGVRNAERMVKHEIDRCGRIKGEVV